MRVRLGVAAALLMMIPSVSVVAQPGPDDVPPSAVRGARVRGVAGEITAIDASGLTLQTFRGETARVRFGKTTEFKKDIQPASLADFKVGERVFVEGAKGKDGVVIAEVLHGRSGAAPMGRGASGQAAFARPEDNGKTYILGEVAKIDGVRLTVKKPDQSEQLIELTEETSLRNLRRESISLADVKVGDMVHGQGAPDARGIFVPRQLNAGRRPQGERPPLPPDGSMPPPNGTQPPPPGEPDSPAQSAPVATSENKN